MFAVPNSGAGGNSGLTSPIAFQRPEIRNKSQVEVFSSSCILPSAKELIYCTIQDTRMLQYSAHNVSTYFLMLYGQKGLKGQTQRLQGCITGGKPALTSGTPPGSTLKEAFHFLAAPAPQCISNWVQLCSRCASGLASQSAHRHTMRCRPSK